MHTLDPVQRTGYQVCTVLDSSDEQTNVQQLPTMSDNFGFTALYIRCLRKYIYLSD